MLDFPQRSRAAGFPASLEWRMRTPRKKRRRITATMSSVCWRTTAKVRLVGEAVELVFVADKHIIKLKMSFDNFAALTEQQFNGTRELMEVARRRCDKWTRRADRLERNFKV